MENNASRNSYSLHKLGEQLAYCLVLLVRDSTQFLSAHRNNMLGAYETIDISTMNTNQQKGETWPMEEGEFIPLSIPASGFLHFHCSHQLSFPSRPGVLSGIWARTDIYGT
jgi:hypothetical protein